MPRTTNGRTATVCLVSLQDPMFLPVPNKQTTRPITAHQELSVCTERHFTSVPRHDVTSKFSFLLQGKAISCLKHGNGVVQALADKECLDWMQHETGHRVHGRIRNVLDRDTNIPFPHENFFVVTARYHFRSALVFDKDNGIDRSQVVIVFLSDLTRGGIVRDNLVVAAAHHKIIIIMRVKLNHIRDFFVGKRVEDLATFRVP